MVAFKFNLFAIMAVVLMITSGCEAFWRMRCHAPFALARIDPLVNPGSVSDHAHTIHGGINFNENTNYANQQASECTTCAVSQDKSAYWTPSLHFKHASGKVEVVEQAGGMLAYYFLNGDNIKAFPEGFQMISGDTTLRNYTGPFPDASVDHWTSYSQETLGQMALGFNCLSIDGHHEDTLYRHFMPDNKKIATCDGGLRLELAFPSCNDGRDDSPNHKDHMAFSYGIQRVGDCPDSHNKRRFPTVMFETNWNTQKFIGSDGNIIDGEFVISNGDPTGYGYHGDFINGWNTDVLQQAIDNPSCQSKTAGKSGSLGGELEDCDIFLPYLNPLRYVGEIESSACAAKYKLPALVKDEVCTSGMTLPGDQAIYAGPEPAPKGKAKAQAVSSAPPASTAAPTPTSAAPVYSPPAISSAAPVVPSSKAPEISIQNNGVGPSSSSSTPVYVPATTVAPVSSMEPDGGRIVGTTTFMSDGNAWVVFDKEVWVTTTVYVPAPTEVATTSTEAAKKHRRHAHRHIGDAHALV